MSMQLHGQAKSKRMQLKAWKHFQGFLGPQYLQDFKCPNGLWFEQIPYYVYKNHKKNLREHQKVPK